MKKTILGLFIVLFSVAGFAQQKEYQLSTHILDISEGIPAENVKIKLEKMNAKTGKWEFISAKRTMKNGRINDFLPLDKENNGTYKFTF